MVRVVMGDEYVPESAERYVGKHQLAADTVSAVDHVGNAFHNNYRG
jgi:hypothetical protein